MDPLLDFNGKVALVTGGSRGLGYEMVKALAERGADIVIASRKLENCEKVADEVRELGRKALPVSAHLGRWEQCDELVELVYKEFGKLDILINNATPTGGGLTRLESIGSEVIEGHMAVNYYAALWSMQKLFAVMKAQGGGRIINMCSLNGINAHRYSASYNASKEALRALTRTAAAEWGAYGITCNVICPAAVSDAWGMFVQADPEGAANLVKQIPMRRVGDSQKDIAPLAVFLASDAAGFITGNTIHADGGGHIGGVAWNFDLPE